MSGLVWLGVPDDGDIIGIVFFIVFILALVAGGSVHKLVTGRMSRRNLARARNQ